MEHSFNATHLFRRQVALPSEHGAWVFLFSPLLIGLFAGGSWSVASLYLIVAALATFLIRQPATTAVKVYSGRRARRELPAAWFWLGIYGLVASLAMIGLAWQGFGYLFILALPGIPVFAWHLWLVSRRAERRQLGVELVGSGVLALAAPAGYWIGVGEAEPLGWLLLALSWLQSAASIVYAHLRLEQRELKKIPDTAMRIQMGWRALLYASFNLLLVIGLSMGRITPPLLPLPYALQWAESLYGTLRPAAGYRPTAIGVRQLIVSSLFTLLFILAWRVVL